MAKIKTIKGVKDKDSVKLPGKGGAHKLQRKARAFEFMGMEPRTLIVIGIIAAGLIALLTGTIIRGNANKERRQMMHTWEAECTKKCKDEDPDKQVAGACVDKCVALKNRDYMKNNPDR